MSHAAAVLSITEERLYTARLGERTVTGLAVSSAWEGFTKYTDRNGAHLIVLDAEQRVITGTPELLGQLTPRGEHHAAALPEIGMALAGGFYTGIIVVDGKRYALITAGAAGELCGKWSDNHNGVGGAISRADGLSNTKAMADAGSELAKAALSLTIGGHTDWYIPSRDEQELQYRNLKPTTQRNLVTAGDGDNPSSAPVGELYSKQFPIQTTAANFREGGADALSATWYWSSTQHASNPSYAWYQYFDDGFQSFGRKDNEGRARAVRRLPI